MELNCYRSTCNGVMIPTNSEEEHLYRCSECERDILKEEPTRHYADANGGPVNRLSAYLLKQARGDVHG